MNRPVRIACVTAGLIVSGAVLGAVAGMASMWITFALSGHFIIRDPSALLIAAFFGAPMGAVALPVTAWVLLRRVALGRVIALSVAGTTIGGILGWYVPLGRNEVIGALQGALLGFVVAALLMWVTQRRRARLATQHR